MKPLFLILGRTCSGKDTLVRKACEHYGWNQLISYTTRPRRAEETGNNTHIFVDDEFYNALEPAAIAAYTEIGPYKYWSTVKQVNDPDTKFYIIDALGVDTIREHNSRSHVKILRQLITIYVSADYKMRRERWAARSKSIEDFERREANEAPQFDKFEEEHGKKLYDEGRIIYNPDGSVDFAKLQEIIRKYTG